MNANKPSILRTIFSFMGKFFKAIRLTISILFTLLLVVVIAGLFVDHLPPMADKSALYLAPTGILVDQKSYIYPMDALLGNPAMSSPETLVKDIIEAVDTAAKDNRITHLLLDTDHLEAAGIAKLDEISHALIRFKQTNKPIIAVADNFSQSQYFLAAHADQILLNPMGSVLITGFGAYGHYFRDALDWLKVKVHVSRAGQYKSAAEPYLNNEMSTLAKEETSDVVNRLWQSYTSKIEQLRQLDQGAINSFANNLHTKLQSTNGDTALLAQQENLVDLLATRSEMHSYLNQQIPSDYNGEFIATDMAIYLAHTRREQSASISSEDKVAVLVAKGTILDGEQPEGTIGGDTLAKILNELRYDEQVKALVLRIDSPGGSAFASDVIRDALYNQNRDIPIVVSMGSYAASGGYWIAAEADKILAMPTTITGSIGVYSMIPTVEDSLAALGIYSDGVGSTDIAGIMQLDRPMSHQAKIIIQSSVENIYSRFIDLVASGRQASKEQVAKMAQGRIWTGQQAMEMGLVDQLGSLNDAINAAAELAGINDYGVIYPARILSPYEQFLQELSQNFSVALRHFGINSSLYKMLAIKAQPILTPLKHISTFNDPKGIYLHCDACPM